jgi:hypothetical protein
LVVPIEQGKSSKQALKTSLAGFGQKNPHSMQTAPTHSRQMGNQSLVVDELPQSTYNRMSYCQSGLEEQQLKPAKPVSGNWLSQLP